MNLYSKVNKKLAEIRKKHQNDHSYRVNKAYSQIPMLKDLDQKEKDIGYRLVKAAMNRDSSSLKDLEIESEAVKNIRKELLFKGGFPEDYLEMTYDCSICKDTGNVGTNFCNCKKKMLISELYHMSGIEEVIKYENFKNFDLKLFRGNRTGNEPYSPREAMESIRNLMLDYVNNFSHLEKKNILFYGPVGTGKTYLCNCIAQGLLTKGHTVVYQTVSKLMNFIADYNFSSNQDKEDLKEKYQLLTEADLLIIDDLGTEIATNVNSSNLFELLNDRMIENKATIISTNLEIEEIAKEYGNRIASRIFGGYKAYKIFGDDLRIKKLSL